MMCVVSVHYAYHFVLYTRNCVHAYPRIRKSASRQLGIGGKARKYRLVGKGSVFMQNVELLYVLCFKVLCGSTGVR